jgi:hypothetical protein
MSAVHFGSAGISGRARAQNCEPQGGLARLFSPTMKSVLTVEPGRIDRIQQVRAKRGGPDTEWSSA